MAQTPRLTIVIPAYNEVRSIGSTLAAIRGFLDDQRITHEIIVCADGTDGTRERALEIAREDHRVQVLGQRERGGKGRAVRESVARARGEIIGFVDADYKTPIEDLAGLLTWLERGFHVVIGSRAVSGARIDVPQPLYRRVGSHAFGVAMHLTMGLWDIRDTQCGFKFFQGWVARDLFARQRIDGYMFDVEILYLARRSGYRIREVGVRWRDDGDSRLELLAGNWQNMLDLLKIRFTVYPEAHPEVAPLPTSDATGTADV